MKLDEIQMTWQGLSDLGFADFISLGDAESQRACIRVLKPFFAEPRTVFDILEQSRKTKYYEAAETFAYTRLLLFLCMVLTSSEPKRHTHPLSPIIRSWQAYCANRAHIKCPTAWTQSEQRYFRKAVRRHPLYATSFPFGQLVELSEIVEEYEYDSGSQVTHVLSRGFYLTAFVVEALDRDVIERSGFPKLDNTSRLTQVSFSMTKTVILHGLRCFVSDTVHAMAEPSSGVRVVNLEDIV